MPLLVHLGLVAFAKASLWPFQNHKRTHRVSIGSTIYLGIWNIIPALWSSCRLRHHCLKREDAHVQVYTCIIICAYWVSMYIYIYILYTYVFYTCVCIYIHRERESTLMYIVIPRSTSKLTCAGGAWQVRLRTSARQGTEPLNCSTTAKITRTQHPLKPTVLYSARVIQASWWDADDTCWWYGTVFQNVGMKSTSNVWQLDTISYLAGTLDITL